MIFFRFDGTNFKDEPSTQFAHKVGVLGSYRNSPFTTGSANSGSIPNRDKVKTEILDYEGGQWIQTADYPFSNPSGTPGIAFDNELYVKPDTNDTNYNIMHNIYNN